MSDEIQLATPEQLALGERLREIFLPSTVRRLETIRQQGGRYAHYTSADSALKIIRSKTLWLRSTTAMSDYSEVQHGFREVGNHPALPHLIVTLDKQIPNLGTQARDEFGRWWNDIQLSTFSASLSEHNSSEDQHGRLSMWRGFSRGSARVALILRPTLKVGSAQPLRVILNPVEYYSPDEIGSELRSIGNNVEVRKSFLETVDNNLVTAFAFLSLLMNVLCLKHVGFKEEREWRIVYLPKIFPTPHMKWSVEQIDGVPQRVFNLPLDGGGSKGLEELNFANLLERVIIGPSQYPWIMYDAFVEELRAAGIADAEKRVFVSGIPIRT